LGGGGVAHLRGRHGRVSRRERQAMYWTSIVVTVGFLIAGLALMGLGVAGAVWSSR
jgi:hypothetical protein